MTKVSERPAVAAAGEYIPGWSDHTTPFADGADRLLPIRQAMLIDQVPGTYEFSNNLYFSPYDSRYFFGGNDQTTDQWNTTMEGGTAVFADPEFVNVGGSTPADYGLQASSPCRDSGTDVGLTVDFDGLPVPQGEAPDIGAIEFDPDPTGGDSGAPAGDPDPTAGDPGAPAGEPGAAGDPVTGDSGAGGSGTASGPVLSGGCRTTDSSWQWALALIILRRRALALVGIA